MRARRHTVRRAEAPDDRRDELADVSGGLYLFGTRPGDCNAPGCPFLEEQLGRLDARLGVKAGAHHPLMEGIRERDQHHSLMMRHVATDDRHARALREPGSSVVEGLVESVRTARAGFRQALEVPDGGRRIDHRRQRRRIGGDDDVVAEPPLEPEARHTEVRILVGHLEVTRVVARLRHPPRHAAFGAVRDLTPDDEPARLLQQAARRRTHHERGH